MSERGHPFPAARVLRVLVGVLLSMASWAADANAQFLFGQNKVVYEDREWLVFEDGPLHVFFYPGEDELARFTLEVARETYDEYSEYFRFEFEEPIPLILYGTHHGLKQTHVIPNLVSEGTAGFTEFAKGRVALRATGNRAELRHLIRHEMVHAFMLSKLATVMSDRQIFEYEGPPLWFIEGLAESIANEEPDWRARMVLRDAVLYDGLVPIPEMWRIWGSFQMYKQGESILDFLREQYDDALPTMLLEQWWRGRHFEEVLEAELGMDLAELDRRWRDYLKRRYFPEILERRSPLEQGEIVDDETYFETAPLALGRTEDGSLRMVALSYRDGPLSLYEVRLPVRGEPEYRRLVEGGRKAAFESLPPLRSRLGLHDRREIAFVAKHGGRDALYVYDLEEEEVVEQYRMEEGEPVVEISSPTFSPDGRRIAFSGLDGGGTSDLWIVERDGGRMRRLTDDVFHDTHPSWHPEGGELLFASDRDHPRSGQHSIHALDLGSGEIRRRIRSAGQDTAPRWLESGEGFVFTSDRDGAPNVFLARGDSVAALSDVTGGEFFPHATEIDGEPVLVASVFHQRRFLLHHLRWPDPATLSWSPALGSVDPEEEPELPPRRPSAPAAQAKPYEVDFGLDFVQSVVALDPDLPYGSGASLGFTDMLGNHQVFVHFGTATDEFDLDDLNAGLTWTDRSSRWNRHFGVFRLAVRPNFVSGFRNDVSEVRTGAFFGLTYPISRFRRLEFSTVARHLERDPSGISGGSGSTLGTTQGRTWLWSGYVSYVQDNVLWSWEGPMRGRRTHLTVGHTYDLLNRGFDRTSIQLDARSYHRTPGRIVLALRGVGRAAFGGDDLPYYLRGFHNVRGLDLWVKKIAFTNVELRVPLLETVGLRFPFGDLSFPPIRANFFFDSAWVDFGEAFAAEDTDVLGSFGYGASMTLYPPIVLRMDVLRTHDFQDFEPWDVEWSISLIY